MSKRKKLSTGRPLNAEEVAELRRKYREFLAQGGQDSVEIGLNPDNEIIIKPLDDEN